MRGGVGERGWECARKCHDNAVILLVTVIHGGEELVSHVIDEELSERINFGLDHGLSSKESS